MLINNNEIDRTIINDRSETIIADVASTLIVIISTPVVREKINSWVDLELISLFGFERSLLTRLLVILAPQELKKKSIFREKKIEKSVFPINRHTAIKSKTEMIVEFDQEFGKKNNSLLLELSMLPEFDA